ncbi:hypothetical protein M422DRAFT_252914 [Sphaerobolus stellatus SS14]|uniref:Uncharacterized protein n=1 Tax=Sphaerobolus stellatus (strain SS14) TaxID=990650 RepID=A0A0C9UKQ8_SPHS4|nr:hypothetical protein M422DRAFT_252914 [Sphaerobolus stellatus SS14]
MTRTFPSYVLHTAGKGNAPTKHHYDVHQLQFLETATDARHSSLMMPITSSQPPGDYQHNKNEKYCAHIAEPAGP